MGINTKCGAWKSILKECLRKREVGPSVCVCVHLFFSLVDGLQEFPLVLAHTRVVDLLHQLGVFVDKPRFSQDVGCCVLYLSGHNVITTTLATARTQETDLKRENQAQAKHTAKAYKHKTKTVLI